MQLAGDCAVEQRGKEERPPEAGVAPGRGPRRERPGVAARKRCHGAPDCRPAFGVRVEQPSRPVRARGGRRPRGRRAPSRRARRAAPPARPGQRQSPGRLRPRGSPSGGVRRSSVRPPPARRGSSSRCRRTRTGTPRRGRRRRGSSPGGRGASSETSSSTVSPGAIGRGSAVRVPSQTIGFPERIEPVVGQTARPSVPRERHVAEPAFCERDAGRAGRACTEGPDLVREPADRERPGVDGVLADALHLPGSVGPGREAMRLRFSRGRAASGARSQARAGGAHARLVHAAGGALAARVSRSAGEALVLRARGDPGALRRGDAAARPAARCRRGRAVRGHHDARARDGCRRRARRGRRAGGRPPDPDAGGRRTAPCARTRRRRSARCSTLCARARRAAARQGGGRVLRWAVHGRGVSRRRPPEPRAAAHEAADARRAARSGRR